MQKNSWEKQYPALKNILLMTYNAEKNLTLLYVGGGGGILTPEVWENIITSKSPIPPSPTYTQLSSQPFRGWGRNGFDTSVNVVHQQNGWRALIKWWFPTLKFCISRLKIRR